jgi:hypothetical protein
MEYRYVTPLLVATVLVMFVAHVLAQDMATSEPEMSTESVMMTTMVSNMLHGVSPQYWCVIYYTI